MPEPNTPPPLPLESGRAGEGFAGGRSSIVTADEHSRASEEGLEYSDLRMAQTHGYNALSRSMMHRASRLLQPTGIVGSHLQPMAWPSH